MSAVAVGRCGAATLDGSPCRRNARVGGRCEKHAETPPATLPDGRFVSSVKSAELGLTEEQREAALEFAALNPRCSVAEAALAAGCRASVLRWAVKRDEGFREEWRAARGMTLQAVEDALYLAATDPSPENTHFTRAASMVVKREDPEYRDRGMLVSPAGDGFADPLGILEMSIEQRLVIRRRLLVEHPELVAIAGDVVDGVAVDADE